MRSSVLALLCAFVAACSSPQPKTAEPARPQVAASEAPTPSNRAPQTSAAPRQGTELLGTKAHEWHVDHWFNSPPLKLADLRGRVVLVRWFMSTACPMCSATAPTLRSFDHDYRARGLTLVGMYHHKDPEPLDPVKVGEAVKTFGYTFPVAIDTDWKTLKEWWLDGHDRDFTSVSFLIDKQGTIRFIHPGGKYEMGSEDERELRRHIEELLSE